MSGFAWGSVRRSRRCVLVVAAATVSIPLLAQAAAAHVVVWSPDAVRGGETALLSFRVPDESATAGTVAFRINLPVDEPVADVMARPMPGWTVSSTERSLPAPTKVGDFTLTKVPASVTWTAAKGTSIAPGQFQLFDLVINPVPDTPTLTFTATQTYSDGKVVRWDQPAPADGSEADFPAPEIALAAGSSAAPTPAASATTPAAQITVTASPVALSTPTGDPGSSDNTARWLGGAALVVAAGALVVMLLRRRTP